MSWAISSSLLGPLGCVKFCHVCGLALGCGPLGGEWWFVLSVLLARSWCSQNGPELWQDLQGLEKVGLVI